MTLSTTAVTTGTAADAVPVVVCAGLYAPAQRLREADAMLVHLADRFASAGVPPPTMSTHRVELGPAGAVLACSLYWSATPELDVVRPILRDAARGSGAGVVLDDAGDGSPELVEVAQQAARAGVVRAEGRAVVFAGCRDLLATLTVREILDRSAIDSVSALANGVVVDTDRVDTRGHVRPIWRAGRLDLLVQPAVGDVFVPFEVRNPTPCCAEHA